MDEEAGLVYYMARDGDNHMKMQLHRVGLDGAGDERLTDPAYNHSVTLSPDGKLLRRRRPDPRYPTLHSPPGFGGIIWWRSWRRAT